jgi:hypothetical protein
MNEPKNMRDFQADYVFQEYPKWVTLKDGSQELAQNADEEAVLIGETEEEELTREQLLEKAKALGLTPHHATGAEKLQQLIAEAEAKA